MKRYLVSGFLLIVPLFAMSMAAAELVKSLAPTVETNQHIQSIGMVTKNVTIP